MQQLNFQSYNFRFKNSENKVAIFDEIRKKFIILTPEEWVRQHTLNFLTIIKKYPASMISIEKEIRGTSRHGTAYLRKESVPAPEITITQNTFDQIARYNLTLKAKFLMVTNGHNHYFCQMDFENEKYIFLKELPHFETQ